MTVKECYSQMGGDYNNVLSRFYDEAMIKRLLGRFIDDTSFRALEQAMAEGDVSRPSMRRIPSGASVRACRLPSCAAH